MSSVWVPIAYSNLIVAGNLGTSPVTNPLNYVPHTELSNRPPTESAGDNAHATRVLRCRWQDRWTLAWQLGGGPCYLGATGAPTAAQYNTKYSVSASSGDVALFSPHAYPYNQQLVCQSVSMAAEGNPIKGGAYDSRLVAANCPVNLINNFDHAILTCEYASPQEPNAGPWLNSFFKENFEPSTKFITLPRNNLFWDAGLTKPVNVNEAPGMEMKCWQWTVERRKIAIGGTLLPLLSAMQGCVNSDTPSSAFVGSFAAGTVLFEGATLEGDSFNDGTPAVKAKLKFKTQNVSFNLFPHVMGLGGAAGLKFDNLYTADGSQFYLYPTANLGNLISSAYW
jgi:hypothetical protein